MSSQFVDMNDDGFKDILVGSFSGAPQWLEGSEYGYLAPKAVVDKDGEEILIKAFWNIPEKKWDDSERSGTDGHCTSSSAIDWDGDGDFDLLLGDYYGGRMYLRINEGSAKEPAFATTNTPVQAGGQPLVVDGKLAAPCVVDWDEDGILDLLISTGDGGLYFFRNTGSTTDTRFAEKRMLIAPKKSPFAGGEVTTGPLPLAPDTSFHVQPCDYDGDGDLDLLIGGRSAWMSTREGDEGDLWIPGGVQTLDAGSVKRSETTTGDFVWLYRRK
ncbi:MAG: hypothetical protein ACI8QS_003313 [Planctomycetota bacterium]|jgi:hypothetical protein